MRKACTFEAEVLLGCIHERKTMPANRCGITRYSKLCHPEKVSTSATLYEPDG